MYGVDLIMNPNLFKTRASSLQKIKRLFRYRHPADLFNEFSLPMALQKMMLEGNNEIPQRKYFSPSHLELMSKGNISRKQLREETNAKSRLKIIQTQDQSWSTHLTNIIRSKKFPKINAKQQQNIFNAVESSKQRHQEKLALNRFGYWASEYAKGFKFDIQINPVVLMKMVNPSFGYLNLMPNEPEFKLIFTSQISFIHELIAASVVRQKGYILHSNELLAYILWKRWVRENASTIRTDQFCRMMKCYKFNVKKEDYLSKFEYSLKKITPPEQIKVDNYITFDQFRQIFLDRGL